MPYPYEPYDPQLAGVKLPQASQFQAYDPSAYGQQNVTPPGLGMAQGAQSIPTNGQNAYQGYGAPMSDPQAGVRAGIMAGLQGATTGSMDEPIPPEYLAKAHQLQALMSPGPVEQRFLEANAAVPENVHGLRAHLAGIGKGLLMGGLGGAVLGGVDPSMTNRAWHRAQLPGMAQAAQYEQQDRQAQLARAKELEGLTGIDPITGLRGPTALNRDYMNALAFGRLGQGQERIDVSKDRAQVYRESIQQRIDHYKTLDTNAQKIQARADYNSGMLNTPEGLEWAAKALGIPTTLMPKFQSGAIKVGADFNFIDVRTGQPLTNPETGQPIASSQKTTEANKQAHNKEMEAQGRARLGQGAQRLSQQQLKMLSDAEQKEVKSIQKPSMFGPDSRPMEEQQADYNRKVADVHSKYAAQKQAGGLGNSNGVRVTSKDTGRPVRRIIDGKVQHGIIMGIGPDNVPIVNWK